MGEQMRHKSDPTEVGEMAGYKEKDYEDEWGEVQP